MSNALLHKLRAGQNLQGEEASLLADIVESWAHLSERAKRFDLSMADLRRMLGVLGRPTSSGKGRGGKGGTGGGGTPPPGSTLPGLPGGSSLSPNTAGPSTANTSDDVSATDDTDDLSQKPKRDEHGRRGAEAFTGLTAMQHAHCALAIGCTCPVCLSGKLYRFWPRRFVSIAGQAPFVGCHHQVDRLQCNHCKEIFEAPLPEAMQSDGIGNGRLSALRALNGRAVKICGRHAVEPARNAASRHRRYGTRRVHV